MKFSRTIMIATLGLSAACSSDSNSSDAAAVVQTLKNGICEYPAGPQNPGTRTAFEQLVCKAGQITGTYTEGANCPTANVIHTCDVNVVTLAFTFKLNFFADHTEATGTAFCQAYQAQGQATER